MEYCASENVTLGSNSSGQTGKILKGKIQIELTRDISRSSIDHKKINEIQDVIDSYTNTMWAYSIISKLDSNQEKRHKQTVEYT